MHVIALCHGLVSSSRLSYKLIAVFEGNSAERQSNAKMDSYQAQ